MSSPPAPRVRIDDSTWVLALTGAGVSAESGIPTFRGSGGLWESQPVEWVASPVGFRSDPALVWRFYLHRRAHAKTCSPNPGHAALAELERRIGDRFLLATQNVDGLHLRAGSERVVELHGNIFKTRCSPLFQATIRQPGKDLAQTISTWLAEGDQVPVSVDEMISILTERGALGKEELSEARITLTRWCRARAVSGDDLAAAQVRLGDEVRALVTRRKAGQDVTAAPATPPAPCGCRSPWCAARP